MAKKELQVSAIENGTVIDHIPADKLFDVINVLGITGMDNAMTFGANLKSSKLGKKQISFGRSFCKNQYHPGL